MQRDGISEPAALARMQSQLPETFFLEHADFIIKNNHDLQNLETISKEVIEKVKGYYTTRY
jgi:dephospho-CoA kinase